MFGVLEINPTMHGIAGVEAVRCFEIPYKRPIVYRLRHGNDHTAGTWFDDYAIKNGSISSVEEKTPGTRLVTTRDSAYVILVRTECDKDGDVSKTVIGVYYRPNMSMRVLTDLIENEQT
jgi:hypothetical protein